MNRDALVVGINRYPFLKESPTSKALHLENPARDAEAIASQLEKYGKDEKAWSVRRLPEVNQDSQLKVGIDTVVKENELYGKISELFSPKTYPVPDVALLFFAGHGLRQERDGKTEGFLASSDASPRKEKWGISLTWLREQLLNSPVKKQIIWLDCCHSGELLNFLTSAELKDWLYGGDRCLIAACRGDREAYGVEKQGVLTRVLLKALDPMQQPEGKWIGSGTVTESIELELETNPMLKRQIPLCRNFGERIRFWKGMKQPDQFQGFPSDKTREYVFNDSLKSNITGIPSEIYSRLYEALLNCDQFDDAQRLNNFFRSQAPLRPWGYRWQAGSPRELVEDAIGFLNDRFRDDTKENALVILVKLLAKQIDPADSRHRILAELAQELERIFGKYV